MSDEKKQEKVDQQPAVRVVRDAENISLIGPDFKPFATATKQKTGLLPSWAMELPQDLKNREGAVVLPAGQYVIVTEPVYDPNRKPGDKLTGMTPVKLKLAHGLVQPADPREKEYLTDPAAQTIVRPDARAVYTFRGEKGKTLTVRGQEINFASKLEEVEFPSRLTKDEKAEVEAAGVKCDWKSVTYPGTVGSFNAYPKAWPADDKKVEGQKNKPVDSSIESASFIDLKAVTGEDGDRKYITAQITPQELAKARAARASYSNKPAPESHEAPTEVVSEDAASMYEEDDTPANKHALKPKPDSQDKPVGPAR